MLGRTFTNSPQVKAWPLKGGGVRLKVLVAGPIKNYFFAASLI